MKSLCALALIPFAAMANPLVTDFNQVFADNAANVVVEDGISKVELPGKIFLNRNSEGKFLALDGSDHDPVGCMLRIMVQSYAVGQTCEGAMTDEQAGIFKRNLDAFAAFYSENNVPAREVSEVRAAMQKALDDTTQGMKELNCSGENVAKFQEYIGLLTNSDNQEVLAQSLAAPRLPVTNPCQ